MRRHGIVGWFVLLSLLAGFEVRPEEGRGVLVRSHFGGLAALGERSDCGALSAVLKLPASRRLWDGAAQGLAGDVPRWFGWASGSRTNRPAAFDRLARSLGERETVVEVLGSEQSVTGWAVAIRLGEAEARALGSELGRGLAGYAGVEPPAEGLEAWELKASESGGEARFARVNEWAVTGRGREAVAAMEGRVRSGFAPFGLGTNHVFRGEVDLAGLARLAGWRDRPPGPVAQWPRASLTVEPRNGRLRTRARFEYLDSLKLELAPWELPRRFMREPIIGFTAMQGAESWWKGWGVKDSAQVEEWPKQMFLWSLAGDPWLQYLAVPLEAPTDLLSQLAPLLPMDWMTHQSPRGELIGVGTSNAVRRLEWRGIPYLVPHIEAVQEDGEGWVLGGLFPMARLGETAPEPLLEQVVGRTNLVWYEWETTGREIVGGAPGGGNQFVGRLLQYKQLLQFVMMLAPPSQLPALDANGLIRVPGGDWMDAALPFLGETVTEVTMEGPSTLALNRQSQVGFAAVELIHWLRWLDNPGFPGWKDPEPVVRRQSRPATRPAPRR